MSTKSKSIVTSMVTGTAFVVAYVIYVTNGAAQPQTLQAWAIAMIAFLGLAIVALIIVMIVFHILLAARIAVVEGEHDSGRIQRILDSTMAEDEMDRLINLRSARAGYICAGIGFAAVLATLALGGSAVVALHVLFGSFFIGSLVSGAVSLYGYERGLRHG